MTHWAVKYIGLPYCPGGRDKNGVDCWGLLKLIYQDEWNMSLPELPGLPQEDLLKISREILAQIKVGWTEVSKPRDGCAVAMSQRDALHHVGVWVDVDGGRVLHSPKAPVVAESIRFLSWKGFKKIQFFVYGHHH